MKVAGALAGAVAGPGEPPYIFNRGIIDAC